MLPFMTDQQGDPSKDPARQNTVADQTGSTCLGGVLAQRARKTRQTSMCLMVLSCVGVLVLLGMIKKSQPQKAKAAPSKGQQSQIEAAVKRLTGLTDELAGHMDQLVHRFNELSAVAQVAVEELIKNPFEMEVMAGLMPHVEVKAPGPQIPPQPEPQEVSEPNGPTPEEIAQLQAAERAKAQEEMERKRLAELAAQQRAEQARRQQVTQMANGLRLQGIIHTAGHRRCIIDGHVLIAGDQIYGFRVVEIKAASVELFWPDPQMGFSLKIAE